MTRQPLWALTCCAAVALLSGCEPAKEQLLKFLPSTSKSALNETDPNRGLVVARLEHSVITAADLKMYIQTHRTLLAGLPSTQSRQDLIQRAIENRIVMDAAKAAGLDQDPQYIQAAETALTRLYYQRFIANEFPTSEKDLRDYYQKLVKEGELLERHGSMIELKSESEAKQAMTFLKKNPSMAKLSKLMPGRKITALDAQKLTSLQPADYSAEVSKSYYSLQAGQFSNAIKSPSGYCVLFMERMSPMPFESVKLFLKSQLDMKHQMDWAAKKRASMNIVVDEQALNSVDLSISKPAPVGP